MKLLLVLSLAAAALCSNILLPSYPLVSRFPSPPHASEYMIDNTRMKAVKHPFLQTWFPGGSSGSFPSSCPMFWTQYELTWFVYARVNGETYSLFGCPDESVEAAEQLDLEFSATHTKVTLRAGSAEFLLDFFSPVSLTDYVRQSIPYSYLTVTVKDAPRLARIDILSAIDDSWNALDNTQIDFTNGDNSVFYAISGVDTYTRAEWENVANWGHVVFAANKGSDVDVSFQSGNADEIKERFKGEGTLESDNSYEPGDLVALSYRLNNVASSPSVTFAVGVDFEEAILWLEEPLTLYYRSEITDTEELVDHFFADEEDARAESVELDEKIISVGQSVSDNYTDIVEASVRQIFGGFEIVIPLESKDPDQAKIFIKEISTNGNVHTLADLIPKTMPFFYLLAPDYIRLFCEPVMEYTLQWPVTYAFHDLGKRYPNATGETVEGQQELIMDQTSVIHWMAYSYVKASGDTEWIKPYLGPMQNYADHLVNNSLYPPSESSSVDAIVPSPNQTILASYGVIGMNAFGQLSGMTNYSDKAREIANKVLGLSFASNGSHLRTHYNDTDEAWVNMYTFGYDKMLELNTFNASTYEMMSDFYETKLQPYGFALDDRVEYMVSELAMWGSATTSNKVRDNIIDGIHAAWTNPINSGAVGPTQWNVTGPGVGEWFLATAKSILGSHFMPAIIAEQAKNEELR